MILDGMNNQLTMTTMMLIVKIMMIMMMMMMMMMMMNLMFATLVAQNPLSIHHSDLVKIVTMTKAHRFLQNHAFLLSK